jgi:two-component system chemotaxis response regulator CheY
MRILIVDDDNDLPEAMLETLEQEGYRATCVSDGLQALEFRRSAKPPCLILLDLMMPRMNGWEFREPQLRHADLSSIPVVVISAHDRPADLPVDGFLKKPVRPGELLTAVGRYCRVPDAGPASSDGPPRRT